jgi:hypothetical protein
MAYLLAAFPPVAYFLAAFRPVASFQVASGQPALGQLQVLEIQQTLAKMAREFVQLELVSVRQ